MEVGYAGASVGIIKQHCEMWDISKHEDARFSNWWGFGLEERAGNGDGALTRTDAYQVPHQPFDLDSIAR